MSPQRPYSHWRRAGDFVILSGQLGVLPDTTFVEGGTANELRQALANAKGHLEEAGASLGDVVKACLLYTSPSPRDRQKSRMPSSA